VSVFNVATGAETICRDTAWLSEDGDNYVRYLGFLSDGRSLAVANDHAIGFWDVAHGEHLVSVRESWARTCAVGAFAVLASLSLFVLIRRRRNQDRDLAQRIDAFRAALSFEAEHFIVGESGQNETRS
jgi:hypothetical protein